MAFVASWLRARWSRKNDTDKCEPFCMQTFLLLVSEIDAQEIEDADEAVVVAELAEQSELRALRQQNIDSAQHAQMPQQVQHDF